MSDRISDKPTVVDDRDDETPPPQAIAAHFPQLEIIEVLGRGGMGVVYKARQKRLDRLVALKVLPAAAAADPLFAERFAREARALARLQHPNIVTVHDSGQSGGWYYLIMEFVDGVDLRGMMSSGRLTPEQALGIVPRICDALEYAHDEGVTHRDIKPENVLIDTRGRVKIADFGLAKLAAGRSTDYTLTAPRQVMGTLHYMAPEQLERPADVDHRADIYALGVVIYEMLTGELPIGRFPLPSEKAAVDGRVDEIVLHALEKDPSRRYQRASDLKTDLEHVSGFAGAVPAPASFPSAPGSAPAAAPSHATGASPARGEGLAYVLWLLCLVGLCGMHRIYLGRYVTGVIWLLTGGLCMIGQIVDLFLIPGMTRLSNLERAIFEQELARVRSGA